MFPSKVFVGIVSYNSIEDLPQCLASLSQQTYTPIVITILDNASTDGSIQLLEKSKYSFNLLKNDQNVGFGQGHNQIIRTLELTSHDFYMPLNPDVQLDAHYIENLVATLQQIQFGWGTGKLLLTDERDKIYSVGHALYRGGYAINIGYKMLDNEDFNQSREIFGAPGTAPLIKADLLTDLAPNDILFDPLMFMYFEDVDLDWRARRQGWKCWYEASAIAYHRGSSANSSLRMEALKNRFLSVLKNAFWQDLLFHNLPLIFLHCLGRLIVSPRHGLNLISVLSIEGVLAIKARRKSKISRKQMSYWYKWAHSQPTNQPHTFRERWRDYKAKNDI